jgi:hypothetical protein
MDLFCVFVSKDRFDLSKFGVEVQKGQSVWEEWRDWVKERNKAT